MDESGEVLEIAGFNAEIVDTELCFLSNTTLVCLAQDARHCLRFQDDSWLKKGKEEQLIYKCIKKRFYSSNHGVVGVAEKGSWGQLRFYTGRTELWL